MTIDGKQTIEPKQVKTKDIEKLYGALTHTFLMDTTMTEEDLRNRGFKWGDYLKDCLEELLEIYDGVNKVENGYKITTLEQEKHLRRIHSQST
jgi:hypothetical protein